MYKEDFERERSDRTRQAGKLESLERESAEKIRSLEAQLKQATEKLYVKVSEVEHYRQQVETLQNSSEDGQQKSKREPIMVSAQHEEQVNYNFVTNYVVVECDRPSKMLHVSSFQNEQVLAIAYKTTYLHTCMHIPYYRDDACITMHFQSLQTHKLTSFM